MNIIEKITKHVAEFKEKRAILLDEVKKDFGLIFIPLFEKYPHIESISWTQYTPYFNDGEECIFSVNYDYLKINSEKKIDYDVESEFSDLLQLIPEDFYLDLFGNHKEIILTNKGEVIVKEYEHD